MPLTLTDDDIKRIRNEVALLIASGTITIDSFTESQRKIISGALINVQNTLEIPLKQALVDTGYIRDIIGSLEATVDNVLRPAISDINSLIKTLSETVPVKLDELQASLTKAEDIIVHDIAAGKDEISDNLLSSENRIRNDISAISSNIWAYINDAQLSLENSITRSQHLIEQSLDEVQNAILTGIGQKSAELEAVIKSETATVAEVVDKAKLDIIQALTKSNENIIALLSMIQQTLHDMFASDPNKYREAMEQAFAIVKNLSPQAEQ
jgi:hypothetical protein